MSDPGYFHNNNNGSITNNNVSSTTISLKEWTKRALLQSINTSSSSSNNNTHQSSALIIAKSLVDQICSTYEQQQQQQGTTNTFGGWDEQLQFHQQQPSSALPTPGSNWSDYIIVHLSSSNVNNNTYNEGYERQQDMHNSQELSDILLNSLINDSQVSSQQPQQLDDGTSQATVSHLNVTQAEIILPSSQNNSSNNNSSTSSTSKLDEMKHIYSLGIVFYQLFTGEEPPHELLQQLVPQAPMNDNVAPTNNSLLDDDDDDDNDVRQFQGKLVRMKEGFKS